jgi:hypothetical protein
MPWGHIWESRGLDLGTTFVERGQIHVPVALALGKRLESRVHVDVVEKELKNCTLRESNPGSQICLSTHLEMLVITKKKQ